MGWIPNFSYVKSSYKDSDEKKFLRKKKKKWGDMGVNMAESPIKAMVDVLKQTKPIL